MLPTDLIYENLSLHPMDNEEWRSIIGYEGLYEISNFGRIKSLQRPYQKLIIKKQKIDKYGYLVVNISLPTEVIRKHTTIHRLVALAFISNPENLPSINHKDGNKLNCRWDNLEWCTVLENNIHALDTKLKVMPKGDKCYLFGMTSSKSYVSKKIIQCDLATGEEICRFDSLADAVRKYGFKGSTNITMNLQGKTKYAYGSIWKFDLAKNEN
jgi:hypothetical protein